MMKFINIASGSKGNASIIFTELSKIVVDFGISRKCANEVLSKYGMTLNDIDVFLFTHNHTDHISNQKYLDPDRCYSIPNVLKNVYTSPLSLSETYVFGDIEVQLIKTSHDADASCGFIFSDGSKKIAYITDTGKLLRKELKKLEGCDIYYFESNYDKDMLETSGRPIYLINRIKSDKGHLSNKKSAAYLKDLIRENTQIVALAHLSEECNTPEKAIAEHDKTWHNAEENKHIKLICCKQYEETEIC